VRSNYIPLTYIMNYVTKSLIITCSIGENRDFYPVSSAMRNDHVTGLQQTEPWRALPFMLRNDANPKPCRLLPWAETIGRRLLAGRQGSPRLGLLCSSHVTVSLLTVHRGKV